MRQLEKMLNSPFKWVGGKSRLRKYIVPIIPEHTCYVEVFSGAAWVLFGKNPSPVEVINDIDEELITFFKVIREKPEEFLDSFKFELVSRSQFNLLANQDTQNLSDIERAHRFYYLIMAGWGGELNYPRFATSITDGGHGNRLIGALKTLEDRIMPIYKRLRTVIIENLDWEECINRYDRKETVFYLDPPYPENGCNYNYNMKDWNDHLRLASKLYGTKAKWILSSYDTPENYSLYKDMTILQVKSASGMANTKANKGRTMNHEILITNFPMKIENGFDSLFDL